MINHIAVALLLSSSAGAVQAAPAVSTPPAIAPLENATVSTLKDRFIEATDKKVKAAFLAQIGQTAPVSGRDVASLFDLFTRFTDKYSRASVMSSLARIAPGSPQLEPMFITYLRQPEPEAQLFGINGAFRLRSRSALPMIQKIAKRKFAASGVTETTMMSERNSWWTQYEALSVLAQWEGEKSLALLESKGQESAKVGTLLGRYYWRQTLPKLKAWSSSGELLATERAALAAAAAIDLADARATRPQMLALLRDRDVDIEIRHSLALKIGVSSENDEIDELVKEHDIVDSAIERMYWATAVFSSRRPKSIPLLVRYARQTDDDVMNKGATAQLIDMLGEAEARSLIDPEKKK